jgi:ribosomal protein L32E
MTKFLRSKWRTRSELGRGRKKKQKYRKATGRHNKVREHMKGNPRKVEIGFKKAFHLATPRVENFEQLREIKEGSEVILAKIGKKKKLEMIKEAEKRKIKIININTRKIMKQIAKEQEKKKIKAIEKKEEKKAGEKAENKDKKTEVKDDGEKK